MTIDEAQQAIIDEFAFFDDWMERYQYLIDLGRKLPPFPEQWKVDDNLLSGCQSKVWVVTEMRDGRLHVDATSDSAIVCGIIALVLRVYSDQKPEHILGTEPRFIEAIGLSEHLSPTRANGLRALLDLIRQRARAAQNS